MIRCYHCGTDNLDGSEYCDECGTKLNATSSTQSAYAPPSSFSSPVSAQTVSPPAPVPPPPPTFTRDTVSPKPATPYTPPPPPVFQPAQSSNQATVAPKAPQSSTPTAPPPNSQAGNQAPPTVTSVAAPNQTATFNGPTGNLRGNPFSPDGGKQASMSAMSAGVEQPSIRAKLVIQRGGKIGKEFPIASTESMIGRWDADGGIFPDVDLDQDDPEAKVSRRHARIQFFNNQYLIEDLGSTNGTFINRGPRLLPGIKQPLNNGDEIIVGKTFLKFVLS